MGGVTYLDMSNPRVQEVLHAMQYADWLRVLASPRIYQAMARKPTREYLLTLHDRYLPYARSKHALRKQQGYACFNVDEERREALADRLRTLLETWTPPELTPEIVETARQLLKAEGDTGSPEAWDAASWESPADDPGAPPEDYLLWPEGIPAILKGNWPPKT
ncbi:hypothetical protein WME88_50555 [Sorangium sp. So ce216]